MEQELFSKELKGWAKGRQPKTLETLIHAFGERSFVVIMFLFMFFPALPLPTAAHLFEAIVIVIAAEMVVGLKVIWIPRFLSSRVKLDRVVKSRFMDKLIAKIEWTESKASPYGVKVFSAPLVNRVLGMVIITFCLAAFFAPPLSGLDTLPAIGVVFISLSILLENIFLLLIGLFAGSAGIVLSLFFASVILRLIEAVF